MASDFSVGFEPADRLAQDRDSVRRRFWIKLKKVAAKLPFTEDLLAAYYCAFDKQTPRHVQVALLGAIAYFILPFDFIPGHDAGARLHRRCGDPCDRDPAGGRQHHQ